MGGGCEQGMVGGGETVSSGQDKEGITSVDTLASVKYNGCWNSDLQN